jgi:hypothetical protein
VKWGQVEESLRCGIGVMLSLRVGSALLAPGFDVYWIRVRARWGW